jgi:hypothetical protein
MTSQPSKFRTPCALAGACCLLLAGSPALQAAESAHPVEIAMATPLGGGPAAAPARTLVPAAGLATYRQPVESPRIRRPLELKLAPPPVRLTKSLQNAPEMKRPPNSESQNALKGHGTADFPDGDIEYKWQIKGSKVKFTIPF